jgi:hypothetical protein
MKRCYLYLVVSYASDVLGWKEREKVDTDGSN